MKRIFTSALVLALTIGAAQAQSTTPGKHQGHKKEHKMAHDQLNLSAEQKASMKKLREDFKKQMNELKKQDQLTVAEMKQRRQALHEQHKKQVDAILTPAQRDQLTKMQADRKNIKKDGKGRFNKGGQAMRKKGADLQKELNLTADQQQKVSKIRSDYRTKMQNLRSDNSVSQDQKRAQMRELVKQQQEEMKSVLTKEQIEKMQSLHKGQKAGNTK